MVSATIVFPCLNEELAVGGCVSTALKVFKEAGIEGSVIVVDNGSTDRSAEVALAAGALVLFQEQPGYGAALRTGFAAATSDIVLMADADGTYELEAIPRLIAPIIEGRADLVLGARLKSASAQTMPFLHRFVGTPIISMLVNHAAGGISISDSQSGFRAFRREAIMSLDLAGTGMEFASEMLVRAGWERLRIAEVNTTYAERIGDSKLETFPDGMRHLRQLLLLSPDIFAVFPGIVASWLAVALWVTIGFIGYKAADIGSTSWLGLLAASFFSILGPFIYGTGMVLRYRAAALGLRHKAFRLRLEQLLKRFSIVGVVFLVAGATLIAILIVNFGTNQSFVSPNAQAVLGAIARSLLTVGMVFAVSPALYPFILRTPMVHLPEATMFKGQP